MSHKQIILATDHAGFDAKEALKEYLIKNRPGCEIKDFGAISKDERDDYPDYIAPAAKYISEHSKEDIVGFIFGGSGEGEAIVANRFRNVRATVLNCPNLDLVSLARQHNNANILSFGARFLDIDFIIRAATLFLDTEFSEIERHVRRISKIDL